MKARCLVPPAAWTGDVLDLSAAEAHHLSRVLRLAAGAAVEVLDGAGRVGMGVFEPGPRNHAQVRLTGVERGPRPAPEIVLAAPWLKASRFEWLLEKATELGVAEICLIETAYSAAEAASQWPARAKRFDTIIGSALKQSGNPWRPRCEGAVPLAAFIARRPAAEPLWYGAPHAAAPAPIQPSPARCWLVIGPEGGLTTVEEELLQSAGGQGISLGATTLRAETAAVALTAVCQACCRKGSG